MMTCEPLPDGGEDDEPLTLFAVDSPASPSASRAKVSRRLTRGGSGRRSRTSFATYDPATSSWRTRRVSLDGEWETFSGIWPASGMTRNGTAYQQPTSAPPIYVSGSGSWPTPNAAGGTGYMSGANRDTWRPTLEGAVQMAPEGPPPKITAEEFRGKGRKAAAALWPTPTVGDSRNSRNATAGRSPGSSHHSGTTLSDAIRMLPTPTANRWDGLQSHGVNVVSGSLNPTWVEWLMGYPAGWTDCEDSETP